MPLKMTVNHRDMDMPDAYLEVVHIRMSKTEMEAAVSFKATVTSPEMFRENYIMPLDLDGPNPFKQAYLYIKGLEQFVTAKDVL